MLGRPSDETLVRRAAAGDRGAFDDLVLRHRDRVYAIALRLTQSRDDAEDVLQETFIAAYRALGSFAGRAQVSTWLHRIAVNKSYDLLGRRRPQADLESVAEPVATVDEVESSSRRAAILRALASLPEEFRTAVVLCDITGLTPSEAADVLGVPSGTVKSRTFRARALLAQALREDHDPTAREPTGG